MGARLLQIAVLSLIVLHIAVCTESSKSPSNSEAQASQQARIFWQAAIDKRFADCWASFSDDYLRVMQNRNPDAFGSREAYNKARSAESKRKVLTGARVSGAEQGPKPGVVKVQVELTFLNQTPPLPVEQSWEKGADGAWRLLPRE